MSVRENVLNKIEAYKEGNLKITIIENNDEFCYVSGLMWSYMMMQFNLRDRTILNINNIKSIKQKINHLLSRYAGKGKQFPLIKQMTSELLAYEIIDPKISTNYANLVLSGFIDPEKWWGKTESDELVAKTYRLPKCTVEAFAEECKDRGEKLGSVLDDIMRAYITNKPSDKQLLLLSNILSESIEIMIAWIMNHMDGDEYSKKIEKLINRAVSELNDEYYKVFLNVVLTAKSTAIDCGLEK